MAKEYVIIGGIKIPKEEYEKRPEWFAPKSVYEKYKRGEIPIVKEEESKKKSSKTSRSEGSKRKSSSGSKKSKVKEYVVINGVKIPREEYEKRPEWFGPKELYEKYKRGELPIVRESESKTKTKTKVVEVKPEKEPITKEDLARIRLAAMAGEVGGEFEGRYWYKIKVPPGTELQAMKHLREGSHPLRKYNITLVALGKKPGEIEFSTMEKIPEGETIELPDFEKEYYKEQFEKKSALEKVPVYIAAIGSPKGFEFFASHFGGKPEEAYAEMVLEAKRSGPVEYIGKSVISSPIGVFTISKGTGAVARYGATELALISPKVAKATGIVLGSTYIGGKAYEFAQTKGDIEKIAETGMRTATELAGFTAGWKAMGKVLKPFVSEPFEPVPARRVKTQYKGIVTEKGNARIKGIAKVEQIGGKEYKVLYEFEKRGGRAGLITEIPAGERILVARKRPTGFIQVAEYKPEKPIISEYIVSEGKPKKIAQVMQEYIKPTGEKGYLIKESLLHKYATEGGKGEVIEIRVAEPELGIALSKGKGIYRGKEGIFVVEEKGAIRYNVPEKVKPFRYRRPVRWKDIELIEKGKGKGGKTIIEEKPAEKVIGTEVQKSGEVGVRLATIPRESVEISRVPVEGYLPTQKVYANVRPFVTFVPTPSFVKIKETGVTRIAGVESVQDVAKDLEKGVETTQATEQTYDIVQDISQDIAQVTDVTQDITTITETTQETTPEIPETPPKISIGTIPAVTPPVKPGIPKLPQLPFGGKEMAGIKDLFEARPQRTKYSPSLLGIILEVPKTKKKLFTGLEIRGI